MRFGEYDTQLLCKINQIPIPAISDPVIHSLVQPAHTEIQIVTLLTEYDPEMRLRSFLLIEAYTGYENDFKDVP